jgi:hypothetical protein
LRAFNDVAIVFVYFYSYFVVERTCTLKSHKIVDTGAKNEYTFVSTYKIFIAPYVVKVGIH